MAAFKSSASFALVLIRELYHRPESEVRVSWQKEVDELRRRQALAREMGGELKVARQKAQGKLTVRERVLMLADGLTTTTETLRVLARDGGDALLVMPEDQAVLASWRQLLDVGTLQRDEPELAGTARPPAPGASSPDRRRPR